MKTGLKIAVSAALIGAIVWVLGGIHEVKAEILRIDPRYIVPIIALNMMDRGLMAYKWRLLLQGQGVRVSFLRAVSVYCASVIWGMFLPSTIGADAARAYATSRTGADSGKVVASIIIERIVGFISALLLAVFSLCLLTRIDYLGDKLLFVWILAGCLMAGAILLFAVSVNGGAFRFFHDRVFRGISHRPIIRKLREFHETYRAFAGDRRNLAAFFGLTFVEQLLPIADFWLVARGMGIPVGVLYFAAALPLALLISRLPISIDGLGVFEGMFIMLMSLAGLAAPQAVAIAVVSRVLGTITFLPWWLGDVITGWRPRRTRFEGKESQSGIPNP